MLVHGSASKIGDDLRGLVAENLRAERIGGVWPQRRADDCAAGGQRPACPPYMEGGNVAVANGLLAPGMGRDALDGKIDFDQPLGILVASSAFHGPLVLGHIENGLRLDQVVFDLDDWLPVELCRVAHHIDARRAWRS